jgi:hypothetical protein
MVEGSDDFAGVDLGPAMRACTELEQRFVWFLVTGEDGNATEAARKAGYEDNGTGAIRVRAHALTHRERVQEAIKEVAASELRAQIVPVLRATKEIIKNPKHPDHARTLQTMLSRLGHGEKNSLDVNMSGSVSVSHTDEALEQLRILQGLQVPRSKLEEIFGFSGLSRFERMLAERGGPKLIEGEAVRDGG